MDAETRFMQEFLSEEDRDLFFDCFVLPPKEQQKTAKKLMHEALWLSYPVTRTRDPELKEQYINYLAALTSFLRGQYPQKGWIKL